VKQNVMALERGTKSCSGNNSVIWSRSLSRCKPTGV